MGIIYKIDCIITGKSYIGQTRFSLEHRWHLHQKESQEALDGLRSSFPLFHRMIIKYGKDNFIPKILEECDTIQLDEREQYWISYYNTFNDGYNSTIGGQRGKNKSHSSCVSQFTIKGDFVKTFNSAQDAAEEYQISASNIRHNCNGDTNSCKGFLWQWGTDKEFHRDIDKTKRYGKFRPVLQYTKGGNFIREFPCIKEAATETNTSYAGIYNNCRGVTKSSGGYVWRYKE